MAWLLKDLNGLVEHQKIKVGYELGDEGMMLRATQNGVGDSPGSELRGRDATHVIWPRRCFIHSGGE
jgi:hypothetical protein